MDNTSTPSERGHELPAPVGPAAGSAATPPAPDTPFSAPGMAPPLPPMVPAVPLGGQQNPAAPVPAIADDIDLIEKEWVHKAKAIVEQTKHDPHEQKKQISEFKSDYLKKRYNKDVGAA